MNENFIVFANDNLGKLNAAIRDDGSVWFLAKDIAEILEMQTKNALRMLEDSDRVEIYADLGNGRRKYQFVNEPGLYEMIFSSRKTEAKAFKNWVTHDVLPSIRKNGGYIIGQEELKGEDKEKLEEQIRQLAKQVNAYKEDGNLWMKMYFDIQTDYVNAVEKIYGKKKADIDAPENSSEKEYVVTPEGWILPKGLMDRDDT